MSGAYNPVARTLWTLSGSGLGTTLTASANSGPISVGSVADLWLAVAVTGTPTGTSPTLDVALDVQDPDGNWYPAVAKIGQLTTTAGRGTAYAGLHMPNVTSTSAALVLPQWCRVAWTLGGTTPGYPGASISLVGR